MVKKYIQTKMISTNTNIPWFRQTHKQAARHNRRAYDKAKRIDAPGYWEVYRKLRLSLGRSLWKCKSEHLKAIGNNLMTCNPKPFWRFIKSLRQSSTGVSALDTINCTATSTIDKAIALSNQFISVYDCSN